MTQTFIKKEGTYLFNPITDTFIQPFMKQAMASYSTMRLSWNGLSSSQPVIFEEFQLYSDETMYLDVFPDSYASIFFRLNQKTQEVAAFYFGKMLTTNQISFTSGCTYFSVRLPPCLLFKETRFPPDHYINKTVSLDEWTPVFQQFDAKQLFHLSFDDKISFFQSFVKDYYPYHNHPIISFVLINAAKNKKASIKELALELGVSDRHIRNVFSQHIGVSPKQMMQAVRLQRTLALLEKTDCLTETFISSDFYDQAHLTKFIKEATLYKPSDLKKLGQ